MDHSFLPQGYEAPKASSGYMNLEKGTNKFLILDSAIVGYEYWNLSGKPVRVKSAPEETPVDIRREEDGKPERIKHFWAFPVWNFEDEKVQILEITQSTIMREITALVNNEEWGTPVQTYAITVTRDGEKLTTKYTVTPSPAKAVPEDVKAEWEKVSGRGFDLNRLFEGGNPFSDKQD